MSKNMLVHDKLSEIDCAEKVKQLKDSLVTQEQFFMWGHESNINLNKDSCEVTMLIAKHCKPFTKGEFKDMKIAEHICSIDTSGIEN